MVTGDRFTFTSAPFHGALVQPPPVLCALSDGRVISSGHLGPRTLGLPPPPSPQIPVATATKSMLPVSVQLATTAPARPAALSLPLAQLSTEASGELLDLAAGLLVGFEEDMPPRMDDIEMEDDGRATCDGLAATMSGSLPTALAFAAVSQVAF